MWNAEHGTWGALNKDWPLFFQKKQNQYLLGLLMGQAENEGSS